MAVRMGLIGLLALMALHIDRTSSYPTNVDLDQSADDNGGYDIESLYDFLATRGRRNPPDSFWAVRGKRDHNLISRSGPRPNSFMTLVNNKRDGGALRPNSFMSPVGGKRGGALRPNSFMIPVGGKRGGAMRPNSFMIPVGGKREDQTAWSLKPNGFMFPQATKKFYDENSSPRPYSPFWHPSQGRWSSSDLDAPYWQNLARPTGFLFSMSKPKKSDEIFEGVSLNDDQDYPGEEQPELETDDRDKRTLPNDNVPDDINAFYAGRGKRSSPPLKQEHSNLLNQQEMFMATRGK